MSKVLVEIELEVDGILFEEDIEPEIEEWLEGLKFQHLTGKKIRNIIFLER